MAGKLSPHPGGAPVRQARAHGEGIANTRQFEWFARAGLATRGGKTTNQQGAQHADQGVDDRRATARLLRAAIGHGPESSDDTKERIDGLVSGIGYAALAVTAVKILAGSGGGGGVAGHLARMVIFTLIGWFLIKAAIDFNPDVAIALDGALAELGQSSYGPVLLGLVAAGLVCFGAYSIADARYRKV